MKKIYLSGGMTPDQSYYRKWTQDFKNKTFSYFKCSVPTKIEDYDNKFIVQHDLHRLRNCDFVVVNLEVKDTSHHLTGTVVELYEAFKQNKAVYAFCDGLESQQASSPWMEQFITKKFDSSKSLLEFLLLEEYDA